MSKEELLFHLDMIMAEWKNEVMEEFYRDGDGYIPPVDPVDEFMQDVEEMVHG
jgi:hypothetical protein